MNTKFIINVRSGKGIQKEEIEELKSYFTKSLGCQNYDFVIPVNRQETISVTKKLLQENAEQIVAIGGDGTINSVANGFFENGQLIHPKSFLSVAKAGTGSDYFKSIVLGKKNCDWKDLIQEHEVKFVDVGYINFPSESKYENQYFINMASVGIVPDVVYRKNRCPGWLPSIFKYTLPALASILFYKPQDVKLSLDGKKDWNIKLLSLSLSKGKYAGAGMKFGPEAVMDDGFFDITVILSMPFFKIPSKLSTLYTGTVADNVHIFKYKCSQIKIQSETPLPLEFDGELYGTTDVEIQIKKKALPVCFPR